MLIYVGQTSRMKNTKWLYDTQRCLIWFLGKDDPSVSYKLHPIFFEAV